MKVSLGEINNRKAQYMAAKMQKTLQGKFTYDELYAFTRTVAHRPAAIELIPEYTNFISKLNHDELARYSELSIGKIIRGKVDAINKRNKVKAEHLLIVVSSGIDPMGQITLSTVTSKDYKAKVLNKDTGQYELSKDVLELHRGDLIERKSNKTIISQKSYTGGPYTVEIPPGELRNLIYTNSIKGDCIIKPNVLEKLIEKLAEQYNGVPKELRDEVPMYSNAIIPFKLTKQSKGELLRTTILFDAQHDRVETLKAIQDRVNTYKDLEIEQYMFLPLLEVNYKTLRDTNADQYTTQQAYLKYIKKLIPRFKLPKVQHLEIYKLYENNAGAFMCHENQGELIKYASNNLPLLSDRMNLKEFCKYIYNKKPLKDLHLTQNTNLIHR